MLYRIVSAYLCCFVAYTLAAQPAVKRALKAYNHANWYKLEKHLQRAAKRWHSHPLYFWVQALYLSNDSLPTHNDSAAYASLRNAQVAWKSTSVKRQQQWLKRTGVGSLDSLKAYEHHLAYRLFYRAKQSGLDAVEGYIAYYPESPYRIAAYSWRDSTAFAQAEAINTAEAYMYFLEHYPDAPQAEQARQRRDWLLFERMTQDGLLSDYLRFLAQYPASYARQEAEWQVYQRMTADFSLESLVAYLNLFPEGLWRQQALEIAACLAMYHRQWHLLEAWQSEESIQRWLSYEQQRGKPLLPVYQQQRWHLYYPGGQGFGLPWGYRPASIYDCQAIEDDFIWIENEEGLLGIANRQGDILFSPRFTQAEWLDNGLAVVHMPAGKGLVHVSGNWLIEAIYDELIPFWHNTFLARYANRWAILSIYGKPLVDFKYEHIEGWEAHQLVLLHTMDEGVELLSASRLHALQQGEPYHPQLACEQVEMLDDSYILFCQQGLWGVLSANLQQQLPPRYTSVHLYKNTWFVTDSLGAGVLRLHGAPLLVGRFQHVSPGERYLLARDSSGWIVFDYLGRSRWQQAADTAYLLGSAVILEHSGKRSVLLENGIVQDWSRYENIRLLRTTHDAQRYFIQVCDNRGRCGLFDRYGGQRLPMRYEGLYMLDNFLIRVEEKKRLGLVDTTGKEILPPRYDAIGDPVDEIIPLMRSSRFGAFHLSKSILIEPNYEGLLTYIRGGYWRAKQKGKWGLIDNKNKPVLPFTYDALHIWHDTLLLAEVNGQWELINMPKVSLLQRATYLLQYRCASGDAILANSSDGTVHLYYRGRTMHLEKDALRLFCLKDGLLVRSEKKLNNQQWLIAYHTPEGNLWAEFSLSEDELLTTDCE